MDVIKKNDGVPFLAGREVEDPYFFNRVNELNELKRKIGSKAPISIALHGQRRIGKSSILRKLKNEFYGSVDIIPIVIKCEKVFPMSTNNFAKLLISHLRHLTESGDAFSPLNEQEILRKVKQRRLDFEINIEKDGINKKIKGTSEFSPSFTLSMDIAFEMIKEIQKSNDSKIVLLMDEFQELFTLGDSFLWALRGYMNESSASFLVSSSDHRFHDYLKSDPDHPFFNFFEMKKILGVRKTDIKIYITERLDSVNKRINSDGLEYVLKLCEGKPYYIQLLCSKAYDILLRRKENIITKKILEESFNEIFLSPPSHITGLFHSIRGQVSQNVFITMCKYDLRTSAQIAEKLERITTSSVSQILKNLEKLHGVIEKMKGSLNKYKVVDSFLKEWIKREYE